jgi:hypothetical protein
MGRPKEDQKDEVKLAISEHLALHGPKGWPEVQAKFPNVSRATFFRYVKEVREEIERKAADRPGADLKVVQKRIRSRVATPDESERQLKANLPTAPSPAVVASLGPAVDEVFDFMANFNKLLRDADMMRSAAVTVGSDGVEKLRNPNLMDKSISRRLGLMETWLRSQGLVWNYEKLQELYFAVIDEVGKASPEVQQAIVSRIRSLNNTRGMTIDARLI